MPFRAFFRNLAAATQSPPGRRLFRTSTTRLPFRLRLNTLEERALPSTTTVTGLLADPLMSALAAAQTGRKDTPDGPYTKAGPELAQLYAEYEQAAVAGTLATFHASNPYVHIHNGTVLVDAVANQSATQLAADLIQLGSQVTGTYGSMVSAWLPLAEISAAAQLASLHQVSPSEMATAAGLVQSQADKAISADQGRAANHVDGAGYTVGVLSDSFNNSGNGSYALDVLNGDLPPNVTVLEEESTQGADEGRAMAQVVHDVAPGANLMFHTAANGKADFANGVLQLAANGANIITDDYVYFNEPFFQDGNIAQAANAAVNGYGVSYFSCAFNDGTQSYTAGFDGGLNYPAGWFASAAGAPSFDGGLAHNFDASGYNDQQTFTLANGANINLTFDWQQPNYSVSGGSGSQVDMDIYILDSNNVVVAGDNSNNLHGDAIARVSFANTTGFAQTYKVMLVEFGVINNATPGLLKYINMTNAVDTMQNLAFATHSSTSVGHSNAENVQAVGAAYYGQTPRFGVNPAVLETYSGASGCPLLFDTAGNPILFVKNGNNNGLIVAPDGTDTSFFGNGDSDSDGFPNFFGTSEAAPHAAAVAALMDQAIGVQPNPFYLYDVMEHTASDMADPGFDFSTGYGLIDAHAALAAVDNPLGSWTALHNAVPSGDAAGTMLLLPDGTVMVQGGGTTSTWYKLSPDSNGSYVNGAWSQLASMNDSRLYGATQVLPSGKVLYIGGEYSSAGDTTNTGEIYDPVANSWSPIANFPNSHFGDDPTEMLPGGQVLAGYIFGPQTYIYDPSTDTWSQTGTKLNNDRSDEEGWVTLADGSILSYDIFNSVNNGQNTAQRYIPSTGQWIAAGTLPVALTSSALGYEMGPALLLPDGRAFFIGGNGHTALYDPTTDSWTQGPDIPNGQHADDSPGCVLANGTVLFAADGTGGADASDTFDAPTNLYVYDPLSNSMTQVNNPADLSNSPAFVDRMLALPNGQVLFTDGTGQLFVYVPPGAPTPVARPTITSINSNGDGTYVITGANLNGFSEGAAYGDDAEMSSNYPIIQLTDLANNLYYASTYNWTSTAVDTGSKPVGAEFTLPANIGPGAYYLSVIANGIPSAPVLAVFTGSGSDTVILGVNRLGGVTGHVNGQVFNILPGDVAGVDVVNTGGADTDNVLATPAGVPLHIGGGGADTINLGVGGSVQGILGDVTIEDYYDYATLNVDDSSDSVARTVTLDTLTLRDAGIGAYEPDTDLYGQIRGLAPATIRFEEYDLSAVTLLGGTAGNTWNVLATGDRNLGPTISITGNAPAYGTTFDTVNIGNQGTLQDITCPLILADQPFTMLVNVDDSADPNVRTATLTTGWLSGGFAGGLISGLAPVPITYRVLSTDLVTLRTGTASGTVINALGTYGAFNIVAHGATTVVNVGNNGYVDTVEGPLSIEDPAGLVTLKIDDSADAAAYTVAVVDAGPNPNDEGEPGEPWGQIQGLPCGPISYEYADMDQVSLSLSTGFDTVNVHATSGPNTTINVGASNDRQAMLLSGSTPVFTGNQQTILYDSTLTLTTNSQGGVLLELTDAEFSFDGGLVTSMVLNTGQDAEYVDVLATPYGVPFTIIGGRNDWVNIGNNGSLQSIQSDLNIENAVGWSRLKIDDSSDPLARTVTLQTIGVNPADSEGNDDPWGQISGLNGYGVINYEYDDVSSLTLDGGTGGNTWNVLSTGLFTTLNANGATLDTVDTVNVGDAGNMQGMIGSLWLYDDPSYMVLNLDDSADTVARTVTLDTNSDVYGQITGLCPTLISYQYFGTLGVTIDGGSGGNTWQVQATQVPTTLNGGSADDTFDLTATGRQQSNISGRLSITGGGGINMLTVNDQNDTAADTYAITATSITRTGSAGLSYSGLAGITLNGGSGGVKYNLNSMAAGTPLTIDDGAGSDLVNVGAGDLSTLPASVTIHGVSGATAVNLNDQTNSAVQTYTLTAAIVSRTGFGTLGYANLGALTLNGSTKTDVYKIETTAAGTATTVNGGISTDTFDIGSTSTASSVLAGIAGNLTIVGNSQSDTLNIRDGGMSTDQSYILSASTLTGSDFAGLISFAVGKMNLTLGNANNSLLVTAAATATTTTTAGTGSNTLTGPDLTTTWTINGADHGKLGSKLTFSHFGTLTGGAGNDTFKFTGTAPSLSGTMDGRGGKVNKLDYSGYSSGPISVVLASPTTGSASLISGGFSNINSLAGSHDPGDRLTGTDTTTTWTVTALNGGKAGAFAFSGIENLVAGRGTDTFKINSGKGVGGSIDAGAGANVLDYSTWATGVTVNLEAGTATGVGGTVSGFHILNGGKVNDTLVGTSGNDIIRGNAGDDIIDGNGGNDVLIGGTGNDTISVPLTSGRSILIGSQGNDSLTGGTAGCILIGGYTSYDTFTTANDNTLSAILNDWLSGTDYATRIATIRSKLSKTTVHDDSSFDLLTGQTNFTSGEGDWFWAGVGTNPDSTNAETGEQIN